MTIGIYFRPASMSADQYDDIIKRLETAPARPRVASTTCVSAPLTAFRFSMSGNPSKPLTVRT